MLCTLQSLWDPGRVLPENLLESLHFDDISTANLLLPIFIRAPGRRGFLLELCILKKKKTFPGRQDNEKGSVGTKPGIFVKFP